MIFFLQCTHCSVKCKTENNLLKHFKVCRGKMNAYKCMYDGCGRVYETRRQLLNHRRNHRSKQQKGGQKKTSDKQ